MATTQITSISGSQIVQNGTSDKATSGIQFQKVLNVLVNSSFNMVLATIENKTQVATGSVVYTLPQRQATQNYTGTGVKNNPSKNIVQIDINKEKWYTYYLETNDLMRLGIFSQETGITISSALLGQWTEAMALGIQSYLVADITKNAIAFATANTIEPIAVGSATADPTDMEFKLKLWRKLVNTRAGLSNKVTRNYIGVNQTDFSAWCSLTAYNDILLATATLGSDKSFDLFITGRYTQVGGLTIIENMYLGENYAKGIASIDIDEDFDLSSANIILLHKEVIAYPYVMVSAGTYPDPILANIYVTSKFIVPTSPKALRPDLIKGFKLAVTLKA